MATDPLLGYMGGDSLVHRLNGATKLLLVLLLSVAAMIGFDTRLLAVLAAVSLAVFVASRISPRRLALLLWVIVALMLLNNIFIYVFAPGYGAELYGRADVVVDLPGRWAVTQQQLFYQLNVTLKYIVVIPVALAFLASTRPSEFASSLSRIGVPYRIAYSVSLALRYIPDVQAEYRDISHAQQARGIDTSADAGFTTRLKNVTAVLFPLLMSSFDRIETISSAMELRAFGTGRKRTWYVTGSFRWPDVVVIVIAVSLVIAAIVLRVADGSRFWNPWTTTLGV